jgi:hypothetical protein
LREQLRAQHSVGSDGSSENKQIPAQSVFQFPDSNKVHSPVKILIGDKTISVINFDKYIEIIALLPSSSFDNSGVKRMQHTAHS